MQWEYKQVQVPSKYIKLEKNNNHLTNLLNGYGKEGWELVNFNNVLLDGYFVYVFKRSISE